MEGLLALLLSEKMGIDSTNAAKPRSPMAEKILAEIEKYLGEKGNLNR